MAVQGLDGTEAYTRFGSLAVNTEGTLMTQNGLTVMGDGGPITIPANTEPSIAPDGTVSVRQNNGKTAAVGKLKMVTPENKLVRGEDGLFRSPDGTDLPADGTAKLQDRSLEGSNVNPIENMVAMISAARQFETQMKLLQTAEADEKAASQLLSNNGG
jgi:flagellar basal-body rod protein FlgF